MANPKSKEPLLAVMLTFLFVGLGQIYAGKFKRGLAIILAYFVFSAGVLAFMFNPTAKTQPYMLGLIPVPFIFVLLVIIDAYRCARKYNEKNNLTRNINWAKRTILIFGMVFFYAINVQTFLAMYIHSNIVQAFRFPSGSMEPTILPGDRLLANKVAYKSAEPQRGDIIVFIYPKDRSKVFLKRLIAKGGETVEIKNGLILINDVPVELPQIKNIFYYNRGDFGQAGKKVKVPDGFYYVLGDNSITSHDSRYFGFIPRYYILGKAYKIYYPCDRSGAIK